MPTCPACGVYIDEGVTTCKRCEAWLPGENARILEKSLEAWLKRCPICGADIGDSVTNCKHCERVFSGSEVGTLVENTRALESYITKWLKEHGY